MRTLVLLASLLLLGGLSVTAQARRHVTFRLELPDGNQTEIRTPEGSATAMIQLKYDEEWRDFYLDLSIRESPDCGILVSIRDGRQTDAAKLDEFELRRDGTPMRTNTIPTFRLGLRSVEGC